MKTVVALPIVLIVANAFAGLSAFAQAEKPEEKPSDRSQVRQLQIVSKQMLGQFKGALVTKPGCDADGNFYVRTIDEDTENPFSAPLLKFSRTGEKKAVLATPDMPNRQVVPGGPFFDSEGSIYQVARVGQKGKGPEAYIFRYDKDGKLQDKIKLETSMTPYSVAPFKSGELLVRGLKDGEKEGFVPFTAVFASSGKLLKKVSIAEDDADLESGLMTADHRDSVAATAVAEGWAIPSSDGNVYVLRASSPATLYVISPAGEIVRKLNLDPGDSSLSGFWLQESKGELVVFFVERGGTKKLISKVDKTTGEILETYDPGPRLLGLGCFVSPNEFTFAGNEGHTLTLVRTQPR